jgi:hypothetical protein
MKLHIHPILSSDFKQGSIIFFLTNYSIPVSVGVSEIEWQPRQCFRQCQNNRGQQNF